MKYIKQLFVIFSLILIFNNFDYENNYIDILESDEFTSNTFNNVDTNNDILIKPDNMNNIYLNNSFSSFLNYKTTNKYYEYRANKSCMISLIPETNYVYYKIITVNVYRKLAKSYVYKYLFNYDSSLNKFPKIIIYKDESYIFEISSIDKDGTVGVEFTFTCNFKEITDFNYYVLDCDNNYTYGLQYNSDLNNDFSLDYETSNSSNYSSKIEDTLNYPYSSVGRITNSYVKENYEETVTSFTGTLINNKFILTCAHGFASWSKHYVTGCNYRDSHLQSYNSYIAFGQNGDLFPYGICKIKKIFIPKEYFLNDDISDEYLFQYYDVALCEIELNDVCKNIKPLEYRYDNNIYLPSIGNTYILGYPKVDNSEGKNQYFSYLYNFKRLNNFQYKYNGKNIDYGSSGSPIMYKEIDKYIIIGVHIAYNNISEIYKATILTNSFSSFIYYLRRTSL